VSHLQLSRLQMQGYLPLADLVSVRVGLASIGNDVMAENIPNPNKEERVCFVPFLLRGLGFPIHPFLRGLLDFYRIQLHNLTPGSILHISGFVALCELFLGCEAHFELWRELFCLVPRHQGGSIFEVGGAEVWRIAGSGYLVGTPKKGSEEWTSEWFYIEDVPLLDPVRRGLPEFSGAPLKKRLNWCSRNPKQEDNMEVMRLVSKVRLLAHSGLSIIEVMAIAIKRCIQPLQSRVGPLWNYNREDDASRYRQKGADGQATLAAALADLYKGEEEDFMRVNCQEAYSMYTPIEWVSLLAAQCSFIHRDALSGYLGYFIF